MSINELHASHIGRVSVCFTLSSPTLNPQEITNALEIVSALDSVEHSTEDIWSVSSSNKIDGYLAAKDINEHIRYLLRMLLPKRDKIMDIAKNGETYFDVLWESSYLYAGTGPVLDSDCVDGISQLGAGIGFDIYQIDDSVSLSNADEA